MITATGLKNLWKQKIDALDTSQPLDNDALLQALAEGVVQGLSESSLFSQALESEQVPKGYIYSGEALELVAWNLAPTGNYSSSASGKQASCQFLIKTVGSWEVTGNGDTVVGGSGRWKPTDDIFSNIYEINITTVGDTVFAQNYTLGGGWQPFNSDISIILTDGSPSARANNVTVEVRQITSTGNTTGVASFTLNADGELI